MRRDCVWIVLRGEWLAGVLWGEELLERSAFSWYFECWEDVTDADVTISSVCSCSTDWNCDVKFNLSLTDIDRLTDVDLVLSTLSTRDSHFQRTFSPATTSWGTVSQFCGFGSPSLGLIVLRLWLSEELFWVRHRIPPVGPPQGLKPLVLRACLSWVRGTLCSSQRNPSLKWNISLGAFVALSDKHTVLCQQSFPIYYHLKLNSSCTASFLIPFLPCFIFLVLPPFCDPVASLSPFQPYFHSISMLVIIQISSTPLFYSSMSSPLLRQWPEFYKRSADLQHVGRAQASQRTIQTCSDKLTKPGHCTQTLPQMLNLCVRACANSTK